MLHAANNNNNNIINKKYLMNTSSFGKNVHDDDKIN